MINFIPSTVRACLRSTSVSVCIRSKTLRARSDRKRLVRVRTMASSSIETPKPDAEGNPDKKKNRLASEKSPYLLQHQYNPVDWYPWGEEAFKKAKDENKPIFLSVGYSTCHWCHVMERESFENDEVAKLLNDNFVAIKLDREERPDVDSVYMTYIQATSGQGGWPMSVFMTPDLKPFVGATYLPIDRFSFALKDISEKWNSMGDKLEEEGERIVTALRQLVAQPRGGLAETVDKDFLTLGCKTASDIFDDEHGGFGNAPKFPRPCVFEMLFAMWKMGEDESVASDARDMALFTLEKMAKGGVNDQLRGGFHRYSVDRFWHVPHFEKMLYDQSQLAIAFLQAFQVTKDTLFESSARGILDYVASDMKDEATGGFYSAEDADSGVPFGAAEGPTKAEGAYYVWTSFELKLVLGEQNAGMFCEYYGVSQEGNAPAASDPQGEFEGKNILKVSKSLSEVAESEGKTIEEVEAYLSAAKQKLLEQRGKRPKPHLDDKIVTSWNGLMTSAFARAANILEDEAYYDVASKTAKFLSETMWNGEVLFRNYREGISGIEGFAEDYAATICALLDVYEMDGDCEWIRKALKLQDVMDSKFWDKEGGGYFSTKEGDESIVFRKKEDYDGSEPSPTGVACANLLRLASLTGRDDLLEKSKQCASAFATILNKTPFAMPKLAASAFCAQSGHRRVVVASDSSAAAGKEFARAFFALGVPNVAFVRVGPAGSGADSQLLGIETKDMVARDGKATAYVCKGTTCMDPVTDVDAFVEQLKKL